MSNGDYGLGILRKRSNGKCEHKWWHYTTEARNAIQYEFRFCVLCERIEVYGVSGRGAGWQEYGYHKEHDYENVTIPASGFKPRRTERRHLPLPKGVLANNEAGRIAYRKLISLGGAVSCCDDSAPGAVSLVETE